MSVMSDAMSPAFGVEPCHTTVGALGLEALGMNGENNVEVERIGAGAAAQLFTLAALAEP